MRSSQILLRCSLVGLALIFSGTAGAANLGGVLSRNGDRCESWSPDAACHYDRHVTASTATGDAGDTSDRAARHARG